MLRRAVLQLQGPSELVCLGNHGLNNTWIETVAKAIRDDEEHHMHVQTIAYDQSNMRFWSCDKKMDAPLISRVV
ncbi:hypothetical protein DPMN_157066 [Dreissena polymorpha]|uniref:Uncharacterized protein n=1 Tax=Dreissena polymorpha TaxID=45954 RepID=A0A9D4EGE7_DREPO|nr:hypothetical protein DPMN_157066 [Dreissena polymorpha]